METLPQADHLFELRKQFCTPTTPDQKQWELVIKSTSPFGVAIMASERPQVLFRGQNARYSPCLSSLARGLPRVADLSDLPMHGMAKLAERLVRRCWYIDELQLHPATQWAATQSLHSFEDALAQHYGIPTGYMDLTESFDVACFFATCYMDHSGVWQPCADGVGVVYSLPIHHIPIGLHALQPIDLQVLPRPREQFGWVINCGINCDFEDIPGLHIFDFRHDESVSRHFLERFSMGNALFPPDAMAAVADRIMKSRTIPKTKTETVATDLCNQVNGYSGKHHDILTALTVDPFSLQFSNDLNMFDDLLQQQAGAEWTSRRTSFLNNVGFKLVRTL